MQKEVWNLRHAGLIPDTLLLTEHEHVYTFGKSSDENHLLASESELRTNGVDCFHVDRGGDVTYHGPGQLVAYPIFDLSRHQPDIHLYLRNLEEVVIRSIADFGLRGEREDGMTGVWVGGEKIAAIGVKISRWITMHGFALNVNTDLGMFDRIIPCGIFHKGVTSVRKLTGAEIPMDDIKQSVVQHFCSVFGFETATGDVRMQRNPATGSTEVVHS